MPAAKTSAQLGVSTRARRDPHRRVGNANVVASGKVDLSRVGVMGDRELDWIRRLASEETHPADQAREEERQRRKQLSDARKAGWPDTDEARQAEFLRRRQQEKDEAEERQCALDALYASQREQQHQDAIARMELQHLREDPRGRNVKSMLLLHEAIKSREEQVAYNQYVAEQNKGNAKRELEEVQRKAWGEMAEEMHKQMEARQRNLEEKDTNLQMVMYQIDERRRQRGEGVAERGVIAQEAAEEARENALEKEERQRREVENGEYNRANARKAVTKAQRLQQRIQDAVGDNAAREKEEAKVEGIKQFAIDARKKKQVEFERRKEVGIDAYKAERAAIGSPTRRTQDRFEEKGTSFLERMHAGDLERVAETKENAKRDPDADSVYAAYRKAQATASGYLDAEEERAHLEEMRSYPERFKSEQAAEAAARRAEEDRVRRIQRLQAQEKKMNAQREVEAEREEGRLQRERAELEDAQFRAYIASQIPEDMGDVLRARAMQLQ